MSSTKGNILIVEDDRNISDMLSEYLIDEGYAVSVAESGPKALALFSQDQYSLALVDLMLPGLSGFDVIKEIRRNSTLPVIIITAKDSDADKTRGFRVGADDYVQKPFSLIELEARIQANIRRSEIYDSTTESVLELGELCLFPSGKRAVINDSELHLTRKEFDILYTLAQNKNQAISKEELYTRVWQQDYYGENNVLNTHINRLRAKLSNEKAVPVEIRTIWGIGYKLEERS